MAVQTSPRRQLMGVRRLLSSATGNVLAAVGAAFAGIASTAVMAREMEVADFGRVMLLVTAANGIAIFEGLRPVIIYRVASGTCDRAALFAAAWRVNAIMGTIAVVVLAVLGSALVSQYVPLGILVALGLTIVVFFFVMQYWSFLDAESDTLFTGMARGLAWIALYAAFAVLAVCGCSLTSFALALLGMNCALALSFRIRLQRMWPVFMRGGEAGSESLRGLLVPAANNVLFNISAVTINVADRVVIGSVLGARQAGLYAGPSELVLRAGGLIRAGVQVVLPWAARVSDSDGQRSQIWLMATASVGLAAGIVCCGVLFWRDQLVWLLLGSSFSEMGDVFGILSISLFASTLGYGSIIYLNSRGDFETQRRYYVVAALVLLAGVFAAAAADTLLGVAIVFLVARSVDILLAALVLKECPRRDARTFVTMIGAVIAALVAAWFWQPALTITLLVIAVPGWWRLASRFAAD